MSDGETVRADQDAQGSEQGQAETRKPRRRLWRWAVGLLVALGLGVIVGVAVLPTLLCSGTVRGVAVSMINQSIAGEVRLEGYSFGWMSGAKVDGVELRDEQGQIVFSVDRVEAGQASLMNLVGRGVTDLGLVEIDRPQLTVMRYEDGSTNVERAVEATGESEAAEEDESDVASSGGGLPFGLTAAIKVTNGKLTVEDAALGRVETDFEVSAEAKTLADVSMSLVAAVMRDGHEGKVDLNVTAKDFVDDAGVVDLKKGQVGVGVSLADLPMAVVDTLLGKALATELVGERLSLEVRGEGSVVSMPVEVKGQSDRLLVDVVASVAETGVELAEGSGVNWTLRPEALALLGEDVEGLPTLEQPVDFHLTIDDARGDLEGKGSVSLALSSSAMTLHHASYEGPIGIEKLELGLTVGVDAEAGTAEVGMELARPGLTLNGLAFPLGATRADVRLDAERVEVVGAQVAMESGGTIGVEGVLGLDEMMLADFKVAVDSLVLQPLVLPVVGEESFVKNTAGTLTADIAFAAPLSRVMEQSSGGGTVAVREGNLTPLPVLREILGVAMDTPLDLNVVTGASKLEDTADIEFVLSGDRVRLDRADIVTSQATVKGSGVVTFDQQLDTVVQVSLTQLDSSIADAVDDEIDRATERIGGELGGLLGQLGKRLRKDVQEEVTEKLLSFTVTGPVDAPVVRKR